MQIKIALPKGRLLNETSLLVQSGGWGLDDYNEGSRYYRLESRRFPDLRAKVFHEKDIPVQVAIGNYDLGICGLDWIEELLAKYPSSALVKVKDLGYARTALYVAVNRTSKIETIKAGEKAVRIVSEYPNLAECYALKARLKRFNIFPVWGGAEAYPPESADLALLAGKTGQELFNGDLVAESKMLDSSAFLIANRDSWQSKDMSEVLASLYSSLKKISLAGTAKVNEVQTHKESRKAMTGKIRLALPDGHQQEPTVALLNKAGIKIEDYPSNAGNRRPAIDLDGVTVKVVRPQDMPLQVANGNFDLAITGRDWLKDHLCKFPSSPVVEMVDLKFGKVKLVAVVSNDIPVSDLYGLKQFSARRETPFRVASEYVNIADKYARDNRLGMYRIVPTWGATEAFLPDDADLLIENTQTGRTIARHNLKIIDTLFESTACLIGNSHVMNSEKARSIEFIVARLRRAAEDG